MDFGRESAAWLEFDSPDCPGGIEMSISEYNQPAIVNRMPLHPVKTLAPVKYGNTYRPTPFSPSQTGSPVYSTP